MYDVNQNVISNSNVNNTITFTGRVYDSESNLYYYRNRMYSPELARFISKDPKGYVDGMNLYAYVKNNPMRYLDPMGTKARNNVANSSMFDNIWDNAVSGFIYGAGGDVPTSREETDTIVGVKNNTEWEGYVDPNAKALINSLGDNAENWYNKDAPITRRIMTVVEYAAFTISGVREVTKYFDIDLDNTADFVIGIYGAGLGLISSFSGINPLNDLNPKKILEEKVEE